MIGADYLLWRVLADAFDRLAQDAQYWDHLLAGALTPDDVERARDMYGREPPRIVQGFPRQAGPWPQIATTLASETPTGVPLGLHADEAPDGEVLGLVVAEVVEVHTVARNATYGRLLTTLARQAVLAAAPEIFRQWGAAGIYYRGARDFMPLAAYLPEDLWGRTMSWEFQGMVLATGVPRDGLLTPPPLVGLDIDEVVPGHRGRVKVQ